MAFWDDDDEMSDEEYERERKEEKERVNNLPVVKKAKDLLNTIMAFIATVEDEEDTADLKSSLIGDVGLINAKIIGAEAGDLYTIRMENAVLIKVSAVNIKTTMFAFEMFEKGNPEYRDLIKNEIEEFRKIFVVWVATFDRTNDLVEDEWGIWNR
ncbi:hypothetical protein [Jiulongibacter sediminis]|uniref:Uncharacterized protein n=1 Tax=Jiulongibacter sediminis TaxID=1605367 RepID=A0A0P7BUS2_9BACT|nr:hypothetical protein [Jiulongibacter sediminis]KPM48435.1 hypothetical protein AFM12_07310 [Jiulongibacter sediminis]TBX24975.1 hypothetical protein TK44_07315 [Jiulongibacter sediminis]